MRGFLTAEGKEITLKLPLEKPKGSKMPPAQTISTSADARQLHLSAFNVQ